MTAVGQAAENSFVLLQIGGRRVALPADVVAELAPPVRLHTFPHTTPSISGVIVRRGRIIPVYDASSLLLGQPSSNHRFYLIARRQIGKATELGAIPVNGECELATGEMQPPSADRPSCVAGTLAVGAEQVDVIDLDALAASDASSALDLNFAEDQP